MKNGHNPPTTEAKTKLVKLLDLLKESRLARAVDEPIHDALNTFRIDLRPPHNTQRFNELIIKFIQHLHHDSIRLSLDLSDHSAFSKAKFILNRHYGNSPENIGYDQALFEFATRGEEIIQAILYCLTDAVKSEQRQMYVDWIFHKVIDPSDWDLKHAVIQTILADYRNILPAHLADCDPTRLVDDFNELILSMASPRGL